MSGASATFFPYLIDTPEDGYVEEHGWLPVSAATTAEDAAREFARIYEGCEDQTPIFQCDGSRVWLKPSAFDYGTNEEREPNETDWQEGGENVRFRKCDPGEPLAQEWWIIEAIPRCGKYDEEGDFYCLRAEGHDDECSESHA